MTVAEDPVVRVQRLRQTIDRLRNERARAEAEHGQAQQAQQAIFSEHGVSSIQELVDRAQQARQVAEELLDAAEAAVGA